MKEIWNGIQAAIAAVGGWLGYFLGGCDGLLYALIAFVVVDYITGVMCALADKKLSSAVGFNYDGGRILYKYPKPVKNQAFTFKADNYLY